jgi:hypothetical protein
MFLLLLGLGASLRDAPARKQVRDAEDDEEETRSAGEVFGIVMGILIWAGTLLFAIVFYVWKCKCSSCCLKKRKCSRQAMPMKRLRHKEY